MMSQQITINKFAETNKWNKATVIKENGIYVDSYFDNDLLINIYALNEFFVKVVINIRRNRIMDYIPFEKDFFVRTRN